MVPKWNIWFVNLCICLFPSLLFGQNDIGKKIIEFGWDCPKVSAFKMDISEMENDTPFDGVVFTLDFDIYSAFDTTDRPQSAYQYDELSKIDWRKFTDNFLLVRGVGIYNALWLNDDAWLKIIKNLTKISKSLSASKRIKGVGFDPEYYYSNPDNNPWIYKPSLYNNLSYQEVGNFVRLRGKQFIQALQTYKPDIQVLCFWLLGLVSIQNQTHPIAESGMALYPFFVEGMLQGQNASSTIIDGNEYSYGFEKPENFIESGKYRREEGSKLISVSMQSKLQNVSIAQAVFFDLIYAKDPSYDKGFDKATKERWLRYNLYNAFKTTHKYVWFYNERINWWKGRVDTGVARIIDEVKNIMNIEQNNTDPQISGYSGIHDFKETSPDGYRGISFIYTQKTNELNIKLLDVGIKNIQVFNNSRIIYVVNSPPAYFTINLNEKYFKKGNLIILAKDSKGIVSVAYVN